MPSVFIKTYGCQMNERDSEAVAASISDRTALVAIDLVLFRSSSVTDLEPIVKAARRHGALVLLDVYQALGAVPLDVTKLGVDLAVGGSVKWLCGGPGVAYLYVREDLRSALRPALTGWLAHQRPFSFETGPVDRREDSFGFLNGTPHIPALYACRPGLEILNQVGIGPIREKSMRMTKRLYERAKSHGWRVNTSADPAERAGTISIDCPHAAAVSRELLAREILIDYRPKAGVRISPHFYNSEEECDFALAQIADILNSGAWKKHSVESVSAA